MRIRLGQLRLLAIVALLAPLAIPSAARASDHEIYVEGSRSAYVDITIREAIYFSSLDIQVFGGGSFAGLLIAPTVRSSETAGNGLVFAFRLPGLPAMVKGTTHGRLLPGEYRVWIFGDRRPRAVVPVTRGGFVVRPTGPVKLKLHSPRTSAVLAGLSHAEHRYDAAVPADWSALVGLHVTGQRAERSFLCASESDACPQPTVPAYVPSTSDSTGGGVIYPWRTKRHLLVGVEGVRLSAGEIISVALTFAPRR